MSFPYPAMLSEPVSSDDHILGPADAAITLVLYADFQCPLCAQVDKMAAEAARRIGNDLRLVFRHFPQIRVHPCALWAAEVSEAAACQGHFWEMHDYLFAYQHELDIRAVLTEARRMGIDEIQLIRDFARDIPRRRVGRDLQSAEMSAVQEAPILFINGRRYLGECSDELAFLADLQASCRLNTNCRSKVFVGH